MRWYFWALAAMNAALLISGIITGRADTNHREAMMVLWMLAAYLADLREATR